MYPFNILSAVRYNLVQNTSKKLIINSLYHISQCKFNKYIYPDMFEKILTYNYLLSYNILKNLYGDFVMNKYYICMLCGKKHPASECTERFTIKNKFSVCRYCTAHLPYTDGDHTFEGTKYLSYIISSFYYSGSIKNALQKYKFSQHTIFAELLAAFAEDTLSKHTYIKDFDIIVPIPLSKKRFAVRGYNQSALISRRIAEHFDIAYSETLLIRTRNTLKQSSLKGSDRLTNIMDAFSARSDLTGLRMLIFDDIFTTGNTINEAAKTLKNAGAADVVGISTAIVK